MESVISSLIGVIVGFLLQEIRNYFCKTSDKFKAKNLAKVFILKEINKNNLLLIEVHDNWTYLSAILDQAQSISINGENWSTTEWDKYKKDIAQYDIDLAIKLEDIYLIYYKIREAHGRVTLLNKEDFIDYEKQYKDIIEAIK